MLFCLQVFFMIAACLKEVLHGPNVLEWIFHRLQKERCVCPTVFSEEDRMLRGVQCISQVRRENSSRNSISPIEENCQCFNSIRHWLPDDRERRNSKNIRSAKSRHHIARNVLPHSQEPNTACRFRTAQITKSTVAHNCHIKTKCSQQITNRSHQIQITHINSKSLTANSSRSQQIKVAHSKFKSLTANYKSLTANYRSLTANSNGPQQIQIVHSKFKLLTANSKCSRQITNYLLR